MTIVTKELEQRLRNLEVEQKKQDDSLEDMKDFETEVNRLEATLAQIDNYEIKQKKPETDFSQLRETKETERLEEELAHIDQEYVIDMSPVGESSQSNTPSAHKDDKETAKPQKTARTSSATQCYVIALMFNPESPVEWAGSGWRGQGQGMRFTPEHAKQIFKKLKKQWPNYPLKILKR